MFTDLRHAWRLIRRQRGTSALILLTLALGLGGNVTVLTIARSVLLRPLPYADPDRLVMIWVGRGSDRAGLSARGLADPSFFREIRARNRTFTSVDAVELWNGNPSATFDLPAATGAERLRGAFATAGFFNTIGVSPTIGRTFVDDEPNVAVISHELWQRLFGGATDVIGRQLDLATGRGRARALRRITVIGVLPPRVQFSYPESTDVWLSLTRASLEDPRMQTAIMYRIVARLKDDVTLARAREDMEAVKAGIAADLKRDMTQRRFWLEPVHDYAFGAMRPGVQLLGAIAALVFVVSCLNVATLLLARSTERRREIAVQVAIGAARVRIIRQLFTESALMAVMAASASVAAVVLFEPVLKTMMPHSIPRLDEIGVDRYTVASTTALVMLAVVLSTVIPAWRGSTIDPGLELAMTGRSSSESRRGARWRQALITAQVAVVFVLLVSGGLLLRSFWKLQQVDLGFTGTRVFTAEMRTLGPDSGDEAKLRAFQQDLLIRVRALPGVERASLTSSVPLRGVDWTRVLTHRGQSIRARSRDVDPEYFEVMGIPLLTGRAFAATDSESSAPVAIVSRTLAERLYPGENPIGKDLPIRPKRTAQIVGVVGDVRHVRIEEEGEPAYYVPRAQEITEILCLVMRMSAGAPNPASAVRAIVASLDPAAPLMNATMMDDLISESIADRRFYAATTVAFAVVTLLLAIGGLYGVIAQGVVGRTRELGIRLALGADRARLLRLLVADGIRPVAVGVVAGSVAAAWAATLLQRFLFGVHPLDGLSYVWSGVALFVLALVACVMPSLRAMRLDPTAALRAE